VATLVTYMYYMEQVDVQNCFTRAFGVWIKRCRLHIVCRADRDSSPKPGCTTRQALSQVRTLKWTISERVYNVQLGPISAFPSMYGTPSPRVEPSFRPNCLA